MHRDLPPARPAPCLLLAASGMRVFLVCRGASPKSLGGSSDSYAPACKARLSLERNAENGGT